MKRPVVACGFLALCWVASTWLALNFGAEPIDLVRALEKPDSLDGTILFAARLPRVALASLTGASLAAVGVAFQALLRNPLAEPYVLGVSGGAAVGATLAIVAGVSTASLLGASTIPIAALGGGLASTFLVYGIARAGGEVSGTAILLTGVIVNALASSVITFTKTLVSAAQAQELLFWLMGFIEVPSVTELGVVSIWVGGGLTLLVLDSGRMNLLALGRESATYLGVNVNRLERRVFFASSCIVGAIVSLTGLIGFIGLIVPHAVRRLVGPDHRIVVPTSLFLGATTLVLCDLVARASFYWLGTEPPVGAVTALLGGPVFLFLLYRTRYQNSAD